jgi:hypothetical protein
VVDEIVPLRPFFAAQPESGQIPHQHIRVEDPHHELFTEGGGHARQAQLDLASLGRACFQAPILRAPFLGDVHAPQDFDTAGNGRDDRPGDLVDLV